MLVHFHVTFDVPDVPVRGWDHYLKYRLHHWRDPNFTVVSAIGIDDMDEKVAEAIELEAYDRGELPL